MVQEQTLQDGVSMTVDKQAVQTKKEEPTINFAGAYFSIISEHAINIQNQITDNYLENNTAVQDHIAHSPITVTLSGIIAEKTFVPNDADTNSVLERAKQETSIKPTNKLTTLASLLPPVSNAMQIARNAKDYVTASYERYKTIWKNIPNTNDAFLPPYVDIRTPILKGVYKALIKLRETNASFTVETPFETFKNMYIQSISFRQGNENYVGDISITLKQLRFAEVKTTKANKDVMAKYNEWARAQEENNGKAQGKRVPKSILYKTRHSRD